jgi:hypothetical protein
MTPAKRSKRSYRKSTPIGRLRRNAVKASQHAELLRARVSSWGDQDSRVVRVERLAGEVSVKADEVQGLLADLEDSGFVPPEKERSVTWEVGQRVAVGAKFRPKYEELFRDELERDPDYLNDLLVDKVLPTGEIGVRRRGRSPFPVPKTHLVAGRLGR